MVNLPHGVQFMANANGRASMGMQSSHSHPAWLEPMSLPACLASCLTSHHPSVSTGHSHTPSLAAMADRSESWYPLGTMSGSRTGQHCVSSNTCRYRRMYASAQWNSRESAYHNDLGENNLLLERLDGGRHRMIPVVDLSLTVVYRFRLISRQSCCSKITLMLMEKSSLCHTYHRLLVIDLLLSLSLPPYAH